MDKHFWAPFYVCHKVMMGMLDIARILGNQTALAVLKDATPWFRQFLDGIDDVNLAHMVNIEETGGIMELWADLYAFTGWEDALCLMRKMERRELLDAMLAGRDVLTNMHANTTIPEIHGAAAAYAATGEARYADYIERNTLNGIFARPSGRPGRWIPTAKAPSRKPAW